MKIIFEHPFYDEFCREVFALPSLIEEEIGHHANCFCEMLETMGQIRTIRSVLKETTSTFYLLEEEGLLRLSAEFLVLDPRYRGIVQANYLTMARFRLEEHDFDGPGVDRLSNPILALDRPTRTLCSR